MPEKTTLPTWLQPPYSLETQPVALSEASLPADTFIGVRRFATNPLPLPVEPTCRGEALSDALPRLPSARRGPGHTAAADSNPVAHRGRSARMQSGRQKYGSNAPGRAARPPYCEPCTKAQLRCDPPTRAFPAKSG